MTVSSGHLDSLLDMGFSVQTLANLTYQSGSAANGGVQSVTARTGATTYGTFDSLKVTSIDDSTNTIVVTGYETSGGGYYGGGTTTAVPWYFSVVGKSGNDLLLAANGAAALTAVPASTVASYIQSGNTAALNNDLFVFAIDGTSVGTDAAAAQTLTFSSFTPAAGPETVAMVTASTPSSPVSVSDSSTNVQSGLDTLQALTAAGKITSIALTDSGPVNFTLSPSQLAADSGALKAITSDYSVTVPAGTSAATIAGIDGAATIVTFTNSASHYAVTANGDGSITVAASGISDHISGVEQLAFSDLTMTLAPKNSFDEYVALLYQGSLGRTPDALGLNNWEKIANALPASTQTSGVYGLSDASGNYNGSLSVAGGFTNSAEFQAKYGSLTDAQFVTQLYSNILDRAPDTAGYNSWINALTPVSQGGLGQTREHVLIGFAESQEAISNATQGFTGQSGAHAAWLFLT